MLEDAGPSGNETLEYPWIRHDAADLFGALHKGALDPAICREFESFVSRGSEGKRAVCKRWIVDCYRECDKYGEVVFEGHRGSQ